MCSRHNQGNYYKVTVPSGYTCDLTWTVEDLPGHTYNYWDLYTKSSNGSCPSTSSYSCHDDVYGYSNGKCSHNSLSAGTYYAYVNYTRDYSSQLDGETRPKTRYHITAKLNNCSSTGGETTGKKVFITSDSWQGNLGGWSGANSKCQAEANAAGLSGTYKAWISDNGTDHSPSASLWTHYSGQYIDVKGNKIADNWNDLTDNTLDNRIQYSASGSNLETSKYVWTGSNANGTPNGAGSYCTDWTSSSSGAKGSQGWNGGTSWGWSDYSKVKCNLYKHLYCFEQ
jgi:hypothetical protein